MTSGIGRRPGLTSKTLVSPHSHTGDDIVDGSIVNADIGAAAAIAQSKIANLTSDLAGKAPTSHSHSGADITSGTVSTARLGTGAANATTFLRGDQTWAAAGGSETLPASIIDAKGDVIGGTAADTAARLAVGADGQVLTADSSETSGVKWAAAAGGVTSVNGDTGTVTLALLVGADGRVQDARIESSSGSRDLDRAAVNALSTCTFQPAMHGGVAEAGWAKLAYVWTLE